MGVVMEAGDTVSKKHLNEILRVMHLYHQEEYYVNTDGDQAICFNSKPETIDTFHCKKEDIEYSLNNTENEKD